MVSLVTKHSIESGKVPSSTDLLTGELALNTADRILYSVHDDGTVFEINRNIRAGDFSEINIGAYGDITSNNITTSITAVIDSFAITYLRHAKYFVQIEDTDTNEYMSAEVSLLHNDTSSFLNVHSVIFTNVELADFSTQVNSGNIELILTPLVANLKIRFLREGITVSSQLTGSLSQDGSGTFDELGLGKDGTYVSGFSDNISANTVIDSFHRTQVRSANYMIQISDNDTTNHMSSEILLVHDNTTVFYTEYGSISTNTDLATFDLNINTNNVELTLIPLVANVSVNFIRVGLKP